jgi:hypothetical protein
VSVADILWRANILAISFFLQQGKIHKMKIFLEEQKMISCFSFATPTKVKKKKKPTKECIFVTLGNRLEIDISDLPVNLYNCA